MEEGGKRKPMFWHILRSVSKLRSSQNNLCNCKTVFVGQLFIVAVYVDKQQDEEFSNFCKLFI